MSVGSPGRCVQGMASTDVGMGSAWWRRHDVRLRWVRDLLAAEMAALRPGGWAWPSSQSHADVHLVEDAGADSLEMMALSTAFADALDLRDTQRLDALYRSPTWHAWTTLAAQQWAEGDEVLRFSSSGSTGRPARTLHRLAELEQEIDAVLMLLGDDLPQRIVTPVRAHHIYGFLFSALLPQRLLKATGQAVEVLDLVGRPPGVASQLVRSGDLVLGFPDWWRAALRNGQAWPQGVVALSSTAPCPADVARQACAAGIQRWIEIYGSTETAGIGWREAPDTPFNLHPFWQRAEGQALRKKQADGTWGDPVLGPDTLQWSGDRHFVPVSRRDGAVQVGGVNVDPAAVRLRLLQHPAVADAAVRTTEVASGMRLKAFVVPRALTDVPDLVAQDISDWCRRHLTPAARPVDIRIGTAVPRNEMGKLRDW